jgi:hypothetical protein
MNELDNIRRTYFVETTDLDSDLGLTFEDSRNYYYLKRIANIVTYWTTVSVFVALSLVKFYYCQNVQVREQTSISLTVRITITIKISRQISLKIEIAAKKIS